MKAPFLSLIPFERSPIVRLGDASSRLSSENHAIPLIAVFIFVIALLDPLLAPATAICCGDCDADGQVTVDEIVQVVNVALYGCTTPVRYRLLEGSTIVFKAPSGTAPANPEPLFGTFVVAPLEPPPPNTDFAFTLESVAFSSSSGLSIVGGSGIAGCLDEPGIGCIQAATLSPTADMFALVSIGGQQVGLNGGGSFNASSDPPTFSNLKICGVSADRSVRCEDIDAGTESGYQLIISAIPEGW